MMPVSSFPAAPRPRSAVDGTPHSRPGCRVFAPAALVYIALLAASQAAISQEWSDPSGDVTLPNADILCTAVVVDGATIHFLARFADVPLGEAHHDVAWLIDADQDPSTSHGALPRGADRVVNFTEVHGFTPYLWVGGDIVSQRLSVGAYSTYIGTTSLLHIFFPLALLEDDGALDFFVTSTFGGSFGLNESAPDAASFEIPGASFASAFGSPEVCGLVGSDIPTPEERLTALIDRIGVLAKSGWVTRQGAAALSRDLRAALHRLAQARNEEALLLLDEFILEAEQFEASGDLAPAPAIHAIEQVQAVQDQIRATTPASVFFR